MGSGWAKLGIAIAGYIIAGPIGLMAGSFLGSMLFPTEYESEMPTVHDYPVQGTAVGTSIPIVYGTTRLAGNIIWLGRLESYHIKHTQSAGSGGKGGDDEVTSYELKYQRSFLIAICEGPATITRAWKGKKSLDLWRFTSFDGVDNSGVSSLIGKNYAEYSNVCLAYFEDFQLGSTGTLPNFVFEVKSANLPTEYGNVQELVAAGPSEFSFASAVCSNGKFYVNRDSYIHKFNSNGTLDTSWQGDGTLGGFGAGIFDLALDSDENLYVVNGRPGTSASGDTIWKLDPDGNVLWSTLSLNWAKATRSIVIGNDGYVYTGGHKPTGSAKRGMKLDPTDGTPLVYYNPYYGVYVGIDDFGFVYFSGGHYVYRYTNNGMTYQWALMTNWGDLENIFVQSGVLFSDTKVIVVGQHETSNRSVWKFNYDLTVVEYTYGGYFSFHINVDIDGDLLVACAPTQPGDDGSYQMVKLNATDLSFIAGFKINEAALKHVSRQVVGESNYIICGGNPDESYCAWRIVAEEAVDMNFASMIKDLLINEKCGNYDESDLITEDFNSIIAYCGQNDLKGSLAITKQRPLPDWIAYICSHFQGYFYEIGGKVGLNCYRDQASVLSIVQDDLIRDGDEPPVHITKRTYGDTFNRLEASWTDRTHNYKTGVVAAFDRIDQREAAQVRTKVVDLKMITDSTLAAKMVWRIFIDEFYRFSQYTFKLGYKSMLLEVGDVIDVTDGYLLTAQKMRVMSISEEKDGRKAVISAVEDISAFYPDVAYSIQQSLAEGEEDIVLTDGTMFFRESWNSAKLFMSIVPGGTQCNGFYIYKSYDDASYNLIGRAAIATITGGGANSTGTIQSYLPAHTAVIHREGEGFDVNIGILTDLDTAITEDDFFNNRKLARIGDEIIGYQNCVESSVEGTWRVSNLVRGLFGTEPVAHVSGETFNTLDIDFVHNLQQSDIGKTLYFKVVSYYATEIQLISEVSAQSLVVSGDYMKPLPVSLMRINGREGLSTYKTDDVIISWYFCSKTSGFGRGGYGNALWGNFVFDDTIDIMKATLKKSDDTEISSEIFDISGVGLPMALLIEDVDRNGNNPFKVELLPGSSLIGLSSREIEVEQL